MKVALLIITLFSSAAFAGERRAECTRTGSPLVETIVLKDLRDCDDLISGTVCRYTEGQDQFTAYAFIPQELAQAKAGDQVTGFYLTGYVYKKNEITSEAPMDCHIVELP